MSDKLIKEIQNCILRHKLKELDKKISKKNLEKNTLVSIKRLSLIKQRQNENFRPKN